MLERSRSLCLTGNGEHTHVDAAEVVGSRKRLTKIRENKSKGKIAIYSTVHTVPRVSYRRAPVHAFWRGEYEHAF